ncbi:MAG: YaaL family protein [Sarcina sp.]
MQNTIIIEKNNSKKRKKRGSSRNNISDRNFIIKSVEETKGEIERLRNNFNYISDPKLIESLIYKERDAMARYEYLLGQARKKGIKAGMLHVYRNACTMY